jgi:type I restriction enzyme M protein
MTETSTSYTQAELDQRLLDAANALRGPVDAVDFKAYIFPLLFFKRISDTSRWEHAEALESFDGDEQLARHPDNFRFFVPDGCHWEDLQQVSENVGAALQSILDRIQEANPETLAGIFGGVQWADKERLPESALEDVLDVFDRLQLDPESVSHDLLGNAYEYLLKNFADESGKKAGEFFTPRAVVRLMAEILTPRAGESICDPACGSGGLLIESINEVRERGEDARTLRIYGQEVNQTTAAIARMNLYLHDIETFKIARGDTLREPKLKDENGALERFDLIVANPPFSLKKWGQEIWADDPYGRSAYGVPPKGYAELAFVQHMLTVMKPEGSRMAVVMPHGILFRGGTEKRIRREIVESGRLEAVIGLAPNLFYNTPIPACIVVCRGELPPERRGRLLFVDGSERFRKGKNQNELTAADVRALVEAYRSGEDPDGEGGVFVKSVSLAELEESEWDLNIGAYIDRPAEAEIEVATAIAEYLVARDQLHEAEEALDERLRETGFGM